MLTEKRAKTFKALSVLLSYPNAELKSASEEIREILKTEGLIRKNDMDALDRLIDQFRDRDLYDLQERYTLLFDRSRSLSLHLFEHVHGESRDRGQAMVDLAEHYESAGFVISARELPDYLPLFLEFLSVIPVAEAKALLADPLAVLAALEERLRKRKSSYIAVFRALRGIARGKLDPKRLAELVSAPDPNPDDLESLDADWEEAAVQFGPRAAADACGSTRLATRLRAAMRDASLDGPN